MKEKILKRGLILPAIIGIILAIAFFLFLHSTDMFDLVPAGSVIAYHDDLSTDSTMVEAEYVSDCKPNDNLGTLTYGDNSIMVRYCSDYSNLINCVSLQKGSELDMGGLSYVEATSALGTAIGDSYVLIYDGTFGRHKYTYYDTKEYSSEYAMMQDDIDTDNGLVVYYQESNGYGLSNTYKALIYEEEM